MAPDLNRKRGIELADIYTMLLHNGYQLELVNGAPGGNPNETLQSHLNDPLMDAGGV